MGFKVVSVEDEPEIAELLKIVMRSPAIELYHADNGPDGLALIRTIRPDLVMLDVMLPGINGWAVYDAIRADATLHTTPVIMLSVLRETPERRQAFARSTIDVYMTKPFDTIRLRREIERLLDHTGLWPRPQARRDPLTPRPAHGIPLSPTMFGLWRQHIPEGPFALVRPDRTVYAGKR